MPRAQPFFLPAATGRRFCVLREPEAPAVGAIVFVHPFAEEMNNARRIVAVQSRALAAAGWSVLQIDLHGCGDSDGDFSDATWDDWLDDVMRGLDWLHERSRRWPALWGLRAGCLLAAQAACRAARATDLLFWQPVSSGARALHQFLWLKLAQQVIGQTGEQVAGTRELREQLARGDTLHVAGYPLSAALAAGLEAATLEPPQTPARLAWLEISRSSSLSATARMHIERWSAAGHRVSAAVCDGPAFWQTPGVAESPALIDATTAALHAWR